MDHVSYNMVTRQDISMEMIGLSIYYVCMVELNEHTNCTIRKVLINIQSRAVLYKVNRVIYHATTITLIDFVTDHTYMYISLVMHLNYRNIYNL